MWLDGDREAALRSYVARARRRSPGGIEAEMPAFTAQMKRIDAFDVVSAFRPVVFNTFNAGGKYRAVEDSVSKLLALLEP